MSQKDSVPLFRQIVEDLKSQITQGALTQHSPLPSERSIADAHGVSRMTARRALEAIEAEGLAYSLDRKGRFVSPARLNYNLGSMIDCITDAAAHGITLRMTLLQSHTLRADAGHAQILDVDMGTTLYQNQRLFLREDHATFLETETVVAHRCPALLAGLPSDIQNAPQTQRYSSLGATSDIVIRMRAMTDAEAPLLGQSPYQLGIEQEQTCHDASGQTICFVQQIWRGEMAQFSVRAMLNPD